MSTSFLELPVEEQLRIVESADFASLPKEELDKLKLMVCVEKAKEFSVDGFLAYYYVIWRRDPPPYARGWAKAFMSGEWTILYCFRGSTKSTTLTITFSSFCLGHQPYTSALIVQANDNAGAKSSATIADIIEHYDGWKMVFPKIVPDKEKGWGAQGYFVKDEMFVEQNGYGAWLQECQKDHLRDPSFVGLGVNSGEIPGMHPRRLFFDDIHDRKNSAFPKDRENVVDTVRANILPTITKAATEDNKPFVGVACTFWDKSDAYNVMLQTGLFTLKRTPIIRFTEKGDVDFDGKPAKLTWADGFPLDRVQMYRDTNSSAEFARMYLCDISSQAFTNYNWITFPSEEVNWKWTMIAGVDPVNAYMPKSGTDGGRSHFAMCYALRSPTGAMVVADGIVEQCTPTDAETYIMRAHNTFENLQKVVIEADGGGSVFVNFLMRNPKAKVVPMKTSDIFRGDKKKRQYEILEPLLRNGVLQISDANTPYLDAVRNYLDKYPNLDEHAKEWDVADSVVWAVVGAPDLQTKWQVASGNLDLNKRSTLPRHPMAYAGGIGIR